MNPLHQIQAHMGPRPVGLAINDPNATNVQQPAGVAASEPTAKEMRAMRMQILKDKRAGASSAPVGAAAMVSARAKKRKISELELTDFTKYFGLSMEKAALLLYATMEQFTQRAHELGLYEWLGIGMKPERICFGQKDSIRAVFTRVLNMETGGVGHSKIRRIPNKETFGQLKMRVETELELPADTHQLYCYVGGLLVDLTNPEEWDLCVQVWNESNESVLNLRAIPLNTDLNVVDMLELPGNFNAATAPSDL